jgi:hypothetical protein
MLVSGTPPTLGELQEDTTITLAMRIPEPPTIVPTLALEPKDSPGLRYNHRHQLHLQGWRREKMGPGSRAVWLIRSIRTVNTSCD